MYYLDGGQQSPSGILGSSSSIYAYDAYVPSGGVSYSWVMLFGAPNLYNYAQIGNYEVVGHVRHTTIQYAWDSSHIKQVDLAARSLGSSTWEDVTYGEGLNTFAFQINGVDQFTASMVWVPNTDETFSEINTLSVQMMGAINVHQTFVNNNYLTSSGWHLFTGPLTAPASYFGQSGSPASFGTWDKACTS